MGGSAKGAAVSAWLPVTGVRAWVRIRTPSVHVVGRCRSTKRRARGARRGLLPCTLLSAMRAARSLEARCERGVASSDPAALATAVPTTIIQTAAHVDRNQRYLDHIDKATSAQPRRLTPLHSNSIRIGMHYYTTRATCEAVAYVRAQQGPKTDTQRVKHATISQTENNAH